MTFRRFFAVAAAVMLISALLSGNFAHFASAEVVHAYRKPDEADIRWLVGGDPAPLPETSDIVQVGLTTSMLVPRGGQSNSLKVPIPMPPPPQTVSSNLNDGLISEADGVVNITPIVPDDSTSVVLMTGERLPPPAVVPSEESLTPALTTSAGAQPLPKENEGRFWRNTDSNPPSPCQPAADFGTGHKKNRHCITRFDVPDMLGSGTWFTGHSVGTPNTVFALPTMLLSRPNAVERFNAEVQNRIWADFRHWNNAVAINNTINGESRAVEQFSFGLEKQLLRRSSVELRVPVLSQFASQQTANDFAIDAELGNVSVFLKQVLIRRSRLTISSGIGVSLPTAEDVRVPSASARLNNNAYYLVSFLGAQWHPNDRAFGHFVVQVDMPIEKNELIVGNSQVTVSGQQVIRTGIQLGRWIYRVDTGKRPCRLGAFAEIDYAVVTDGSPEYALNGVYVSPLGSRKSTLTGAVGVPMVFGKLTCTNSLILPMSGSNRPFSVGYGFALSRLF